MTKLEQQIFKALIEESVAGEYLMPQAIGNIAQVAAKIALELAEKAYEQGWDDGYGVPLGEGIGKTFKQFIQDYE